MKITDLKPCPFCGGEPRMWCDDVTLIACSHDDCPGFGANAMILDWNRRAALAVQTQQGVEVKKLEWRLEDERDADFPRWNAEWNGMVFSVFKAWWGKENKWGFVGGDCGFHHTEDEAKAAAQADYETRIRSALVDVPAVESEPVAWRPTYQQIKDVVQENVNRMQQAGESHLMMARWLSADIDKLYPSHPPRSLSNEGSEIAKFVEALEAAREWIGVLRASTGDVVMDIFDERDPRVLEDHTHKLIAEALALSTRNGSAGDGAATGTKGGVE